jgi:radical SAM protein with 4Fe4S-binding SPASM domain
MKDWGGLLREHMVRPCAAEIVRVNLAVTSRCDSRCLMCGTWRHPTRAGEEIPPEEITRALAASGLCTQLRMIHITGGEPLVRDDLASLVTALASSFPRARFDLATNAINVGRLRALLSRLEHEGLLGRVHLVISVDGRQPVHERLRGVKGCFRNVMESLCAARTRWPRIPVSLSFTLTPLNKDELWHVYRIARGFGVGFTARFAAWGKFYHNDGRAIRWDPSDLEDAARQMERLGGHVLDSGPPIVRRLSLGSSFLMGAAAYARQPRRQFTCYAGTHSFLLDPVGDVYPCLALPKRMGNIRQERLEDLWFGDRAARVRRFVEAELCHCWSECDVMPSLRRSRKLPAALLRERLAS